MVCTLTSATSIDTNGNVGIGGTTSPNEKLQVVGHMRLASPGAGFQDAGLFMENSDIEGVNALEFNDTGRGEGLSWKAFGGGTTFQKINVYTVGEDGVDAFRFATDSNFPFAFMGGNVGIGTTSPNRELHVVSSLSGATGRRTAPGRCPPPSDGPQRYTAGPLLLWADRPGRKP